MANPKMQFRIAAVVLVAALGCGAHESSPRSATTTQPHSNRFPEKVAATHLPNPWRIHTKVISGGLPEGPDAFRELAELGIQTIISVDGAKPDLETAKRFGLRYVHLPHGYDGVPQQQGMLLAKAVRDLPGPIYIHCHHGKHRSPAAAAVACVGAGLLQPDRALAVLQNAGTSEHYRGLYQSAQSAKRIDDAILNSLRNDFPELVAVPPMAEAMIKIEKTFDHLRAFSANQWRKLETQPNLDAHHEALLLREHYTEILRTNDLKHEPEGFQQQMIQSEATAKRFETLLAEAKQNQIASPASAEIQQAFADVAQSCASCHKAYRDIPLSEKRNSSADR